MTLNPRCIKTAPLTATRALLGELTETGVIYLLTEPVTPLADALAELSRTPASLSWGLYTLAAAVNFLSIDCKMVHGQVTLASVFVDRGMDWKLGGFEMATEAAKADAAYFTSAAQTLPKRYQSPELARGSMEVLASLPVAADWWALGCTIFEIFCGEIKSPADLKKIGSMPEPLKPDYMRLLSANVAQRLRPIELLQNGLFEDAYVSLHLFLEMLNVKDSVEKDRFFTKLAERVPAMPKPAAQWKVLPALTNSLEYGGASAKALEPLLRIASVLSEEEMQAQVVPTVVKLFANTDRAMRIPLLTTLPQLMAHLSQRTVNESVFAHIALGFTDTSPVLRELTVKSMVALAPKLSRASMGAVMRAFAKLQLDEEAAIRTNTTICLGKVAQHLEQAERERVLIPAFTRALKDPFPPGRNAGLLSLTATQQYYKPMDAATRVLPAIAPMLLDAEREVRETALGCLNAYVLKLQQASAAVGRPEGQGPATADASDHAVTAAADSVLKSMQWLSSAAQKAVGAPAQGVVTPGGSGAGRPPPPPNGAPLKPSPATLYAPPAPPSAPAASPRATFPAADGWGDDDLGDAFDAPVASAGLPPPMGLQQLGVPGQPPRPQGGASSSASPRAGGGMQLAKPTPPVDPFASLNLGRPPAPAAMGLGGLAGSTGSLGMGSSMGSLGGTSGLGASTGSLGASTGSLGGMRGMGIGPMGGVGAPAMGVMAPMTPTGGSSTGGLSNLMNFGAAQQPKPAAHDFDSLDPLAMLSAPNKAKKVAATRVAGQKDDWDAW